MEKKEKDMLVEGLTADQGHLQTGLEFLAPSGLLLNVPIVAGMPEAVKEFSLCNLKYCTFFFVMYELQWIMNLAMGEEPCLFCIELSISVE